MSDTTITTKAPKTSVITLHAGGTTMTLLATKRADGSAITTVTTKDGKTSTKGMTETHESMEKAKEHLTALSVKAEKLGWTRKTAGAFASKPDAFSDLPKPPKGK